MSQKQKAIIVFLLIVLAGFIFYISPIGQEFFSKGKLFLPGPLESSEKKEIKETLSDGEIIKITNEYRNDEDLWPLKENKLLNEAAMKRINDMFERQYFEHIAPDGSDISDTMNIVGYKYIIVGENLALGYFKNSKDLVDAWMTSPGHRANILNSKYTEIGVAHKMGIFKGEKQYLAVQVFAKPLSECPSPSISLKNEIENEKVDIEELKKDLEVFDRKIDSIKTEINDVSSEISVLIGQGQSLINQGNQSIAKGNQVYRATKDRDAAEEYWNEGEALQEEGQARLDLAEKKEKELQELQQELEGAVNGYNIIVKKLNTKSENLKELIEQYNGQVASFNKCAGH